MEKITAKQVQDVISNEIKIDINTEHNFNILLPTVERFNGQPIGKRFLSAVQKDFPSAQIDRTAGTVHIDINSGAKYYEKYLVSYGNTVQADVLNDQPWCQEKHHNRIAKNTKQSPERIKAIAKALNTFAQAAEELGAVCSYDFPAIYQILNLSPFVIEKRRAKK